MLKTSKFLISFMLSLCLIFSLTVYAGTNIIGPSKKLFAGESITMLRNNTMSQMMAYVIKSKQGKLIVVDGGLAEDAQHLKEVILANGGTVSAWLVTHPHSDHIEALTTILNEENSNIKIEGIYYNLFDINWYKRNEAYRADMVEKFINSLSKVEPHILHPNIKYGDIFVVDDITINVMNEAYDFEHNSINNSSIAYRLDIADKRVMFLGDMGEEAGNKLLQERHRSELKADIVQMAHHGQYGVNKDVYKAISPTVAMWNAPEWLYQNTSGKFLTLEVRKWMKDIGVTRNFTLELGDQTLY